MFEWLVVINKQNITVYNNVFFPPIVLRFLPIHCPTTPLTQCISFPFKAMEVGQKPYYIYNMVFVPPLIF